MEGALALWGIAEREIDRRRPSFLMGGANPETSRGEQSFGYESWSCPCEQENCQQVAMEGESMTGNKD